LTKYGWPQVVVFPAAVLVVMAVFLASTVAYLAPWVIILIEVMLAVVLVWILMFFRDPERCCLSDRNLLLAPADGRITDIEVVEDPPAFLRKQEGGGGTALRIGIFLSIFDTHINRAPCNVKVERITYKKGLYKNAMNPQSGQVNESNDLGLIRIDNPKDRLIVRQISGAIARRIVCDKVRFGMIKFGSRTELYVPIRLSSCVGRDASCEDSRKEKVKRPNTQYATQDTQYEIKYLVQIGDRVKAGLTPLVKYEKV